MKVLLVDGCDYAASNFEQSHYFDDLTKTWERANKEMIVDEEIGCDIQAYELSGEATDEFVKFIKDRVMDYDSSKMQNFYIVK